MSPLCFSRLSVAPAFSWGGPINITINPPAPDSTISGNAVDIWISSDGGLPYGSPVLQAQHLHYGDLYSFAPGFTPVSPATIPVQQDGTLPLMKIGTWDTTQVGDKTDWIRLHIKVIGPWDTPVVDSNPTSGVTVNNVVAQWDAYSAGGGITSAITSPTDQYGYPCSSEVTCTATAASDEDHRYDAGGNPEHTNPNDTFNNDDAYTWDDGGAGSWKNGVNTGQTVTWIAPDTTQTDVTITLTVKDDAVVPQGETGSRDDADKEYYLHIKVYKIRCVGIQATYDVNIWYPSGATEGGPVGNTSDIIWQVNLDDFQSTGALNVTCWRKAVADIFRPTTPAQHYKLALTLGRYPQCTTTATPSTTLSGHDGGPITESGWSPVFSIPCEPSIYKHEWDMNLVFKVGGIQSDGDQNITEMADFMIYGNYLCPEDEFTRPRLSHVCNWGYGQSEKPGISTKVMTDINGAIVRDSDCICPGEWSTAWDDTVWDNAIPESGSLGHCCCRAHGMMLALKVLGVGTYTHVYVNERSEPGEKDSNPSDPVYCATCNKWCVRASWWGSPGFWNNWEGAARSGGAGTTCYAPAGEFEGTYNEIRDEFGNPWRWVRGSGQYDYCTDLPPP